MSKFKVRFTKNIELTYDLVNEEIVDSWKSMISSKSIKDLCPINHYVGYASEDLILAKIDRLYELADLINETTHEPVVKREITKSTWNKALHQMHVHFPELKNNNNYRFIWPYLSEYNDIIHWLESILMNVWGNNTLSSETSLFRITLDFNKTTKDFLPIPDSAFKLFDPYSMFGELKLHYPHVGKHAQELFSVRDFECPPDQFVPQRIFSASVRMLFTDDFNRSDYMQSWSQYYNARGKDFWKIEIDDPKIALGYMKIGQLECIKIGGKTIEIPIDLKSRNEFRQKLVTTQVVGWEII